MTNRITITTAPCCWGVDDVKNPHLPPWEKVLDEAKAAGFGGLELGPYGYLPLDLGRVSQALNERDLKIVAGTIFDDERIHGRHDGVIGELTAPVSAAPRPPPLATGIGDAAERFAACRHDGIGDNDGLHVRGLRRPCDWHGNVLADFIDIDRPIEAEQPVPISRPNLLTL